MVMVLGFFVAPKLGFLYWVATIKIPPLQPGAKQLTVLNWFMNCVKSFVVIFLTFGKYYRKQRTPVNAKTTAVMN